MFTFFSYGYLDVSVPHVRLRFADNRIASVGLPHSDICGSMSICLSPQLFAACHVLLRLREPRHPPCALSLLRFFRKKRTLSLPYLLYSLFVSPLNLSMVFIPSILFVFFRFDFFSFL